MAAPANRKVSAEEYLAAERLAEFKSEFLNGEMYAWGSSPSVNESVANHVLITANAVGVLAHAAKTGGYTVYNGGLRVGSGHRPDISIVSGVPEFQTDELDILTNPTVIVEVLSPTTEAYDRGAKFHAYQGIESLRHYVLVSQSDRTVDVVSRHGAVWVIETVKGNGQLRLEALAVTVSLDDLYDQVTFPAIGE